MAADEIDWDSVRVSAVAAARSVWPHEVHDFAPWLIQNLDLLGRRLGIHLRAAGREVTVGTFSDGFWSSTGRLDGPRKGLGTSEVDMRAR